MALSKSDAEKVGKMFKVLSNIERIGDHAENIAGFTLAVIDGKLNFSDDAITELRTLGKLTVDQAVKAIEIYEKQDQAGVAQIKTQEKKVNSLTKEYTESHITRLKKGKCDPKSGVIFTDMIHDLQRSADHAKNIAFSLLPENKSEIFSRIFKTIFNR